MKKQQRILLRLILFTLSTVQSAPQAPKPPARSSVTKMARDITIFAKKSWNAASKSAASLWSQLTKKKNTHQPTTPTPKPPTPAPQQTRPPVKPVEPPSETATTQTPPPQTSGTQAPKKTTPVGPAQPHPSVEKLRALFAKFKKNAYEFYQKRGAPHVETATNWAKKQRGDAFAWAKQNTEDLLNKIKRKQPPRDPNNAKPNETSSTPADHERNDAFGSFGFEKFTFFKGIRKETLNSEPFDPETYFSNRTQVKAEPAPEAPKKVVSVAIAAREGGVPSTLSSRVGSYATGLAEADNTWRNFVQNGGLSFIAHTFPNEHAKAERHARKVPILYKQIEKLYPDTTFFNEYAKNPARRVFFCLNTHILQYLVSHCIAYKSIPQGLKIALWDDTPLRNILLTVILTRVAWRLADKKTPPAANVDPGAIAEPKKTSLYKKLFTGAAAIGYLSWFLKINIDHLNETQTLLEIVKKELASNPYATGIRKNEDGSMPIEMCGYKYLVFRDSVKDKLIAFAFFLANAAIATFPENAAPAAVGMSNTWIFKLFAVIFQAPKSYLLTSDLAYLTRETKEKVIQHTNAQKFIATIHLAMMMGNSVRFMKMFPKVYREITENWLPRQRRGVQGSKDNSIRTLQELFGLDTATFIIIKKEYEECSKHGKSEDIFSRVLIKLILDKITQSSRENFELFTKIAANTSLKAQFLDEAKKAIKGIEIDQSAREVTINALKAAITDKLQSFFNDNATKATRHQSIREVPQQSEK